MATVLCQDDLKQLDGLRPAFFSPILPETHVVGTLDQILYDSFPQEVGEGHPIDLHLSIALKSCQVCQNRLNREDNTNTDVFVLAACVALPG